MELRKCPQCSKTKVGETKFCAWCGSKVPPGKDPKQSVFESGLEELIGSPVLSDSTRQECTEEDHGSFTRALEITNESMVNQYEKGNLSREPTPQKYCVHCGEKLLE